MSGIAKFQKQQSTVVSDRPDHPRVGARNQEGDRKLDRIRVLYIDEAFGFGGSTRCMATLVRHLDRNRYDPVVVLSYTDTSGRIVARHFPDVPVILMPRCYISLHSPGPAAFRQRCARFGWLGDRVLVGIVTLLNLVTDFVPRTWRLFRLMHRLRIHRVHANNALSLNQATILAAILGRVPLVCHVRNFEQVTRFGHWLFRRAYAVVVQSYSQKEHLIRQGLEGQRIHAVHEGLSESELAPSRRGRRFRESLGLDEGTILYGIVGMLVPWKGHKVFLEASAIVARRMPDVRAVIVGETVISTDGYGTELLQIAEGLGLDGKVFFSGFCTDTDEIYAALDLVVHASVKPEPFGRVLVEAMAHGKPVIATRGGGPNEIVLHGQTGFLVPPGSPDALAEAIINILRNPELRTALGKAGHDRATEHFTARRQVRMVEKIYEQNVQKNRLAWQVYRSGEG